jgi:ribosomal protein S18 acetylase RimI-like enzyme
MVTVRPATAADALAAAEVMRRAIIETCVADHQNDPAAIEKWIANKTPQTVAEWIAKPEQTFFVAVVEKAVVGAAVVLDSGEIKLLYVAPSAQGAGVGAALMRAMLAVARERDIERVVVESSQTARAFYQRYGFAKLRDIPGRNGLEDSILMEAKMGETS